MKLYPPIIEGTLPAFCDSIIKVPFTMNKSVSKNSVKGFALKIKTIKNQSNILLGQEQDAIITSTETWDETSNIVSFNIGDSIKSKLNIGQFYKVQIAYVAEENVVGYYSTVGIIKYTSKPNLSIEPIDNQTYVGVYSQESKDITEKVYSYCFSLVDRFGNIIETSREQLHNNSKDINQYESKDSYTIITELEENKSYHLIYKIKTVNGLESSVQIKEITNIESIESTLNATIVCSVDYEDGFIDIGLETEEKNFIYGTYYLLRASSEDSFKTWNKILNFSLQGKKLPKHLYKDMTIKQGVEYKYAIQQYNIHGVKSKKIESEYTIQANFEHVYLYDGERQLKIKYNPKITSFKTTLMETKVDTIGNKYPFVFRNGNVEYKEFPISGLISFLSDENKMFEIEKSNDEIFRKSTQDNDNYKDFKNFEFSKTNLTTENICSEREFKINVLNWLNNGKPKLFKSPVEGNYIIRLMNTSLSPVDTLGRMLHSFSCTAYEIADNTYNNLTKFNFIRDNNQLKQRLQWTSVDLKTQKANINMLKHSANSIKLEGLISGDKIQIDDEIIIIGSTGSYNINLNDNININTVQLIDNNINHQGILTYSYYTSNFKNKFDTITGINTQFVPCHQFIGKKDNILQEINNIKENIASIVYIKFYLRDINNYKNKTKIFINGSKEEIELKEIQQYYIKNPKDIVSIETEDGIITEIGYWKTTISYEMENDELINEYNYKKEEEKFFNLINQSVDYNTLEEQLDKRNSVYKQYCNKLAQIIDEAEGR